MNTNTPISENAADVLYDAATAQYALHAVDSNYELYCDDNEMRAGTKASMIEWLHDMWSEFA